MRNCARARLRAGDWSGSSLFESALSVPTEEIEFLFSGTSLVPWAEYVLNPRRLRGSDFLMRWSQGQWSEERIVQAVNDTGRYFALPYGPSGTAPEGDVREFELYFERLEKAGLGKMKRPDLLIVRAADRTKVERLVKDLGGLKELPFTRESDPRMAELIARAVVATECENSLWRAKQMPNYGAQLTPQRRLRGKPGLKKTAVVPTVILKEEDRRPLSEWQRTHGVPVHIWHVFYDIAFGISITPTPWAKASRSQRSSLRASLTRTVTSCPTSGSKAGSWRCPVRLWVCSTPSHAGIRESRDDETAPEAPSKWP
ncbi:AccI family restriction endonuclease [Nitrospira sp. Kam-Ns4a]